MSDHRTFVYLCPTLTLAALASGYHCTFWYVCLRVWMYISVSSVYTVLIWVIIKLCELFAQPPFSTIPRSFSEPRAGRGSRSCYRRLDLIEDPIEDSIENPFEDSVEDSFEDWCPNEASRPRTLKYPVVASLSACYHPHALVFPRKTPRSSHEGRNVYCAYLWPIFHVI